MSQELQLLIKLLAQLGLMFTYLKLKKLLTVSTAIKATTAQKDPRSPQIAQLELTETRSELKLPQEQMVV